MRSLRNEEFNFMNMNNGNKWSVTKSLDIGQMSAFASMKTLIEAKRTFKKVTKKEKNLAHW